MPILLTWFTSFRVFLIKTDKVINSRMNKKSKQQVYLTLKKVFRPHLLCPLRKTHWATLLGYSIYFSIFYIYYILLNANNHMSFNKPFLIFLLTTFWEGYLVIITSYWQFPLKVIFIATHKHRSKSTNFLQNSNKFSIDLCVCVYWLQYYYLAQSNVSLMLWFASTFDKTDMKANCFQQKCTHTDGMYRYTFINIYVYIYGIY